MVGTKFEFLCCSVLPPSISYSLVLWFLKYLFFFVPVVDPTKKIKKKCQTLMHFLHCYWSGFSVIL